MTLQEIIRRAMGDGAALLVLGAGRKPTRLYKVEAGQEVPIDLQRQLWWHESTLAVLGSPVTLEAAWEPLPVPFSASEFYPGLRLPVLACYRTPPGADRRALYPPPAPLVVTKREDMVFG